MAKLIPVLREEASLIIEKLEILRLGLAKEKEYAIYSSTYLGSGGYLYRNGDWIYRSDYEYDYEYDPQILISDNNQYRAHFYDFAERLEEFSAEEVNAIHYLLFSNSLQMNALSIIHFDVGIRAPYAVFLDDRRYMLGIYYFASDANEDLKHFRRSDYVEELAGNYWLVMWFREYT
jgi:hypothetical protein